MAYWGGGGAAGWHGDDQGGRRGRIDGWDYQELGKIYDPSLVRRLVPFLLPHKRRALLALLGMIVYSATSYVQPFIMGIAAAAITEGLQDGRPSSEILRDLDRVGLWLIGLALVSWIALTGQRLITGYIGHHILLDLRKLLFGHLQKLSLRFYDNEEVGRVMSRVTSDVVVMQELLTTGLLNVLADFFGLALIVVFLFLLDAQLAIVSLSVVPVLFLFMIVWQRYAATAFIQVRQAIALVNSSINENVSGVRVVQSLGREEINLREFDELNTINRDSNLRAGRLQAAVMPMVELLSTVATVLVLVVIGLRVFNGSLETASAVGFSVAFLLYIQRFFNPVRDIVLQYTMLQRRWPARTASSRYLTRSRTSSTRPTPSTSPMSRVASTSTT